MNENIKQTIIEETEAKDREDFNEWLYENRDFIKALRNTFIEGESSLRVYFKCDAQQKQTKIFAHAQDKRANSFFVQTHDTGV